MIQQAVCATSEPATRDADATPGTRAPQRRCAIYTRKSTTEGLQRDFNSLDAQRGACESFIRSQPGWELIAESYDDGGFTGANTDRPAFQRLLADVDAGKVDIVVVYKVDRLSRSLLDFAKLMDRFANAKTAFVSVTQNFSTADAMGRLTLNVLMSFAEFEREMIAERTRDKIAASRRRGKWTGGPVPLGFITCDGKLVVDEHEALTVREIFSMYLERRSIVRIIRTLKERGWMTKLHESRDGHVRPRRPWTKDAILRVLRNPLYAGLTQSGGDLFPGEHQAIVSIDDYHRVQRLLGRPRDGAGPCFVIPGYLLRGILHCRACARTLSPASTRRGQREYRYYRCSKTGRAMACAGVSLPANEIEEFVVERLRHSLGGAHLISDVLGAVRSRIASTTEAHTNEKKLLITKIAEMSARVRTLSLKLEEPDAPTPRERDLLDARIGHLTALQGRLARIERELVVLQEANVDRKWVETSFGRFQDLWEALTNEHRERLVRAIVERVVVDDANGSVKMYVADLAAVDAPAASESR